MKRQFWMNLVCFNLISIFWGTTAVHGYEVGTHKEINNYITGREIGGFSLNDYLKVYMGFNRGTDQVIADRVVIFNDWFGIVLKSALTPRQCISDGGGDEDSPFIRCKNHFHDPLKEWSIAGLHKGEGLSGGESSILWAQREKGAQYLGEYSWNDVRDYFHKGLTSNDADVRSEYIVKAFEGIGRLMHLIQDSSVPEHVRNDEHVFSMYNFEKHISKSYINNWFFSQEHYTYIDSALSIHPDNNAPIPIARIVDTDRYDGTDPDVTMTQPIGIAEYTNANFFSTDTICTTDDYPFPNWNSVNPTMLILQDPRNQTDSVQREYLIKNYHGDTGYRLCTAPVLYGQVPESAEYLVPILDDYVYGDYAERLIPRAVSYSAGLMKYFFRGTLEISLPPDGVYAFRSEAPADPRIQGFDKVSLYVKNTTSTGEQMTGGTIELVVKYSFLTDDPDESDPGASARDSFALYDQSSLPQLSDPLYIVQEIDDGNEHQISSMEPTLLEFDLSSNPIPLWAVDVSFSIVYRGRLGGGEEGFPVEEDAVCVGYHDVAEPTSFYLVNDTDTVCYNEEWRMASDVDDVTSKNITEVCIRFSPEGQPQDASPSEEDHIHCFNNLGPGMYERVYLLGDYVYNQSLYYRYYLPGEVDPYVGTATYERQAIKNGLFYDEENDAVLRYYPVLTRFRNIEFWNLYYFYNNDVCTLASCPEGCDYSENPFELVPMQ